MKRSIAGFLISTLFFLPMAVHAGGVEGCVTEIQYWWNGANPTVRFMVVGQRFTIKSTQINVGVTNDALTPAQLSSWLWLIEALRLAQSSDRKVKVVWPDASKRVSSIESFSQKCN